jgi:hypothetical protein
MDLHGSSETDEDLPEPEKECLHLYDMARSVRQRLHGNSDVGDD